MDDVRPRRLQGVVFDLDDTLALEREYVRSGFQAVARAVTGALGSGAEEVFEPLWRGFLEGERGRAFDGLLQRFPEAGRMFTVEDLVVIYRDHSPRLPWVGGMEALVEGLHQEGLLLGVISDGALRGQERKCQSLGLSRWMDPVILTDRWGREGWKPSPRAFAEVEEKWGMSGDSLVYVGDNPHKDFLAPRARGWRTLRLRLPGQIHFQAEPVDAGHAPDEEVGSAEEVGRWVAGWLGRDD